MSQRTRREGSSYREADTASSFPQVTRTVGKSTKSKKPFSLLAGLSDKELEEIATEIQTRLKKQKQSGKGSHKLQCRLNESTGSDGDSRYLVCLIQEGLGNFGNAFYYTREALQSAVDIFEGKKIYADHPSLIDEEVRPERSVKDILGHFENVEFKEVDGRGELWAELVIPEGEPYDWARATADHALKYKEKYADKEFIGLSINASGDAEEEDIDDVIKSAPEACIQKLQEAKALGITTVKVTTAITDATSTDLVTEAGAGGKILKLIEEAKAMPKKIDPKKKIKESQDTDAGNGGAATDDTDVDKDENVIDQLIKKHMSAMGGDGDDEMDEADKGMITEAYEAYKEMGMDEDEAMKCAMKHNQASKKMMQKKEAGGGKDGTPVLAHDESGGDPAQMNPGKESSGMENKESNYKLAGRVAFLEAELKKSSLSKYIDEKLQKTGIAREGTKLLREGKYKSEKDFDQALTIFMEAYKSGKSSQSEKFSFVPFLEKQSNSSDEEALESFSDCIDE